MSLLLQGWAAHAAPTHCPEHFAAGQAPNVLNPRLAAGTRALCFDAFAVLHSALTRTPLYSAEHLTADRIDAARNTPRQGEFHAEPALPPDERAELADYARSGFDRGHMAPSGDMPDAAAQQESFSLANMIPQVPRLNRGLWEGIESAVRTLAGRRGELYVVTGPIFKGDQLATVGHVVVPTYVFKAVLDPGRRAAAAYVTENAEGATWTAVSMAQLASLTGLDIFPSLPPRARTAMLRLPTPTPHGYSGDRSSQNQRSR
jgi:endonuclease G, mitochondrial